MIGPMMDIKHATTALKFLLLLSITGCTVEGSIDLTGQWKISRSDSAGFSDPDFDDSGWDSVDLPKLLTAEKKDRYSDSGKRL